MTQDVLTSLTETRLKKENEIDLKGKAQAVCFVNGELYSCEGSRGIHVYDTNLQFAHSIEPGEMTEVYGVAGIDDGTIVVAASNGLFQMSITGTCICLIWFFR